MQSTRGAKAIRLYDELDQSIPKLIGQRKVRFQHFSGSDIVSVTPK